MPFPHLPMKSLLWSLSAALALSACGGGKSAQAPSAPVASDVPRLAVERYTLPNGLTVLLHQDRRAPVVTVNVWYHVGSRHEPAGRTGFAHLFEHLMFQGSRHVGDDEHFRLLESAGASDVNGTTSQDRTNYYETVPAGELPLALWLESDRMGFLLDTLEDAKLQNQRDVVKNERRQSYEGAPYGLAHLSLYHRLFPAGHPYHEPPIGRVEDLNAATLEDVRAFFRTYYVPSNASLVVAGDFDPAVARGLIEKAFGGFPRAPRPADVSAAPVVLRSEIRDDLTDAQAPLAQVTLAWPTPPVLTEDDVALDVLSNILSAGKGSRLYRAVVETGLAQATDASQSSMKLQGVFTVDATVATGHTPAQVEAALTAVIRGVADGGVSAAEVRRSADLLETQLVMGLENVSGRADMLQTFLVLGGDPGLLPTLIGRYRAVSPERIQDVARRILRQDARVVQTVTPAPKDAAAAEAAPPPPAPKPAAAAARPAPADAWRAQPPQPLPTGTPTLPVVRTTTLENGLSVVHLPSPGLPLVGVLLVSRAGAARDPLGKEGRSALAAQVLTEGVDGADAAALADAFSDLGTSVHSVGGLEASTVSAVVHSRNAGRALRLMARMVRAPTLDPAAVERTRTRLGTALAEQLSNPPSVAAHLAAPLALGREHALARSREGSPAGIAALTVEDLKAALAQAWVASNMALVVVGDLSAERAVELARTELADLPRGTPLEPLAAVPAPTARTTVFAVEVPGAPQTVLLSALPGPAVMDADVPALEMANAALGGLFTSRLNLKLREEMGVSYGAFSTVQTFSRGGVVWAMAPVQADATAPALGAFLGELTGLAARPATAEELQMARESYARSLPSEFVGVSRMGGVAARMFALQLPGDFYATLPGRYGEVTDAAATQAAVRWLNASNAGVLLVGDRARVEDAVKTNALGTLTWLKPTGEPVPVAAPAAAPVPTAAEAPAPAPAGGKPKGKGKPRGK